MGKNDIYHWYNGLLTKNENWPDFKVTLIWPATETVEFIYLFIHYFDFVLIC